MSQSVKNTNINRHTKEDRKKTIIKLDIGFIPYSGFISSHSFSAASIAAVMDSDVVQFPTVLSPQSFENFCFLNFIFLVWF